MKGIGQERERLLARLKGLRDALEELTFQFGYKSVRGGRSVIHTGGLSALETAFEALGWGDPMYFVDTEGICDVKGCADWVTLGGVGWQETGHWCLCSKHGMAYWSGESQPEMKQRAIDREASRGEDGCYERN